MTPVSYYSKIFFRTGKDFGKHQLLELWGSCAKRPILKIYFSADSHRKCAGSRDFGEVQYELCSEVGVRGGLGDASDGT